MRRLILLVFVTCSFTALRVCAEPWEHRRAIVASVHPLATDAGVAALRDGGNAVDAAVATALTLGVVDSHNSGLGGGCFILIRRPDGKFVAIDGRETAPAKAHRDMYIRDGKADGELSTTGALASGTPGALAAYDLAIREHGQKKLAELLLPAAEIADRGFKVNRVLAAVLRNNAKTLSRFEGSRQALLKSDGSPYAEGEILRQPDLARTYRGIAENGIDWFYKGPFAKSVGEWMAENGGIMTAEDFATYSPRQREPLVTTYRGMKIVGFPPPSSGGVHVGQILNILESFDLNDLHSHDPALFTHVVAEAMKLAFADRAYWLGDPEFAKVPRGLVDREYAAQLAKQIDLSKVTKVEGAGTPPRADSDLFSKHTTHIAAADEEGWWVAITATVNTSFGSKVIVPGTGVVLNNQMDDFSIEPGTPNAFGLVGAEANSVAALKRPLSSMSPTIVLKDDRPILTVGAAGGPTIISQVVLAIINHLDLEMSLPRALAQPRFHHQWSPDSLVVERAFPDDVAEKLTGLGHTLRRRDSMGVTQAIGRTAEGFFIGVHDPRVPGKAGGP